MDFVNFTIRPAWVASAAKQNPVSKVPAVSKLGIILLLRPGFVSASTDTVRVHVPSLLFPSASTICPLDQLSENDPAGVGFP